jgi:alpha-L-rhamnosidase
VLWLIFLVQSVAIGQHSWKGSWIKDSCDINIKPAPYFRKTFFVSKKILKARVYIAVAGLYELNINGKKIGDHFLDPMFTRFDRRTLYVTYDVSKNLQGSNNAIVVLLGNGWYNLLSTAVWYFDKAPWRARPSFCMDIQITYTDGSVETISTDKSWKTTLSPVIFNSIYSGEHYDARKEIPGWDELNVDDSKWSDVIITGAPSINIVEQNVYPIRACEELRAVSMSKINDTDYVFDIGRNISGISKIKLNADEGTVVRLKHAEKLYPNGHVDQSNIDMHYRPTDDSDPFQTDIYILNGKGVQIFQPHFNYKGFQYVEVTSDKPITLTKENLTGIFLHSDVPAVGKINCSNPVINKIWQATNNSYLSNLFGYPTDCPQREKNGWTGDAHIAIETGLYNFDSKSIYEKWLADLRDEQNSNGMLPAIVPSSGWGYEHFNTVDWLSALVIIPWELYLFYGDIKPIQENYNAMKFYIDHLTNIYSDGLATEGLGDREAIHSHASVELTSTCYYYADTKILYNTARLLHKKKDEEKYKLLAQKIKIAFNKKFFHDEIYGSGYQTELSAALYWGLVPDSSKKLVAANLAKACSRDSIHWDVGLLGTKTLLNALSENGYADLAYQLASKETYPSYGYCMNQGMTTHPENWSMQSSLNHIFLGEISAWFYKGLGGIKPDPKQAGFKNILIEPHFLLDSFYCEHTCSFGKIISSWKKQEGDVLYKVTIPSGSTAHLILPNHQHRRLLSGSYQFRISK